ncbi:MAG: hypothetical protein F6K28_39320 [Microcoleus sp. SIO2G3]|nr:hypothetical protein [Microcoleus sp. SIO2G3]
MLLNPISYRLELHPGTTGGSFVFRAIAYTECLFSLILFMRSALRSSRFAIAFVQTSYYPSDDFCKKSIT